MLELELKRITMYDAVWNIFLNLIASLIFVALTWLWKNREKQIHVKATTSFTQATVNQNNKQEPLPDHRMDNRMVIKEGSKKFFFIFVTFAALYFSISMPLLFKALFSSNQVLLSDAKIIGFYLPNIQVEKNYLQLSFFLLAVTLYWPVIFLSEKIMSLLHPLIDTFYEVTPRILIAGRMLIFLLFCVPIATTTVWLFYDKTFYQSFITVLIFIFFIFALGQSESNRR